MYFDHISLPFYRNLNKCSCRVQGFMSRIFWTRLSAVWLHSMSPSPSVWTYRPERPLPEHIVLGCHGWQKLLASLSTTHRTHLHLQHFPHKACMIATPECGSETVCYAALKFIFLFGLWKSSERSETSSCLRLVSKLLKFWKFLIYSILEIKYEQKKSTCSQS